MFDELVLPISSDLKLTAAFEGFDAWWGLWLSHVFRCPMAPRLRQINADHEASDSEVTLLGASHHFPASLEPMIATDMCEPFH